MCDDIQDIPRLGVNHRQPVDLVQNQQANGVEEGVVGTNGHQGPILVPQEG